MTESTQSRFPGGMRPRLLAFAGLLLAASGCAVECTLIGCSSGLSIMLKTAPTAAYRIEARSGFGSGAYVYECADPKACGGAFFSDYQPASVIIKVITATGTTTTTVNPTYEKSQPNGKRCGPTCMIAKVEVPFPGA